MKEYFYRHENFKYQIKLPEEIQDKIDQMAKLYTEILYDVASTLYEDGSDEPLNFAIDVTWAKVEETVQKAVDEMG